MLCVQVGNNGLTAGLADFADRTTLRAEDMFEDAEKAAERIGALSERAKGIPGLMLNTTEYEVALEQGLADARNMTDTFASVADTVKDYNGRRQAIQQMAGITSILLVLVAVIGAACSFPSFALLLGTLGFFVFAFAWLAFGLNYTVGVVVADFCHELDKTLVDKNNNNPAIRLYADCDELLGLQTLVDEINTRLNETYDR